jgi:hypothetical protein
MAVLLVLPPLLLASTPLPLRSPAPPRPPCPVLCSELPRHTTLLPPAHLLPTDTLPYPTSSSNRTLRPPRPWLRPRVAAPLCQTCTARRHSSRRPTSMLRRPTHLRPRRCRLRLRDRLRVLPKARLKALPWDRPRHPWVDLVPHPRRRHSRLPRRQLLPLRQSRPSTRPVTDHTSRLMLSDWSTCSTRICSALLPRPLLPLRPR